MNNVATAAAPQPSKLPAPLWHTGVVLLYVLVPHVWWPGWSRLLRAVPYTSGAFDILGMVVYTTGVALVCFGLSLHHTPLEELLGNLWTSWKHVLRDLAIACCFWLVALYASRLIHYLAHSPSAGTSRLVPRTKRELVISVFFAITAGVAEELIFRGYLQKQFTVLSGNVGAGILIQAVLFACFHGYRQTPPTFGQHFFFAILAGLLAQWRKSLLPGMLGHTWLDAYWDVMKLLR